VRRRHIARSGRYLRVADPSWSDPLAPDYARERGGRWNPPRSFAVLYLKRDRQTARRNVDRLLTDQPYGPEDLDPAEAFVLVAVDLTEARYVDVISDAGCTSAGLPTTYPKDASKAMISHAICQPIGQAAYGEGEPGIACRSAAPHTTRTDEELALFSRARKRLRPAGRWAFDDWYWGNGNG
jgi:RES domain-containing protein